MADFSELHRMFPGMHKRPETILCDKNNLQEEIKSESNKTFLLLKNCADYELKFEGKAAKIMCENCKNLTVTLTDPLISGLFEVHKSNNVLIKLTKSCEVSFHSYYSSFCLFVFSLLTALLYLICIYIIFWIFLDSNFSS